MSRFSLVAAFCGHASLCKALTLRNPSSRAVGFQVGELVAETAATNTGDVDNSVFEILTQNVLTNPEVTKAVDEANRQAESSAVLADPLCERDYSQPCPDGWSLQGKTGCVAPASYRGCESVHDLSRASLVDKQIFAADCLAPYPCKGSCDGGSDYESCPVGFSRIGNGFCKAASAAASGCSATLYNFGDMSVGDKQELALICNIKFQCLSACTKDYSAPCPEGWFYVSGACLAPPSYTGPCSASIDTTGMTAAQKQSFAEKCLVGFPCEGHLHEGSQFESEYFNGPIST